MRNDKLNLKELKKELNALEIMIKMGLISFKEYERVMGEIAKEHGVQIVLTKRNLSTNKTTTNVLA